MKTSLILRFALICTLTIWMVACEKDQVFPTNNQDLSGYQEAARFLLSRIAIGSTSEVTIYGPFDRDVTMEEEIIDPDTTHAILHVPHGAFLFFIDDEPELRFGHPVRYAWANPGLNTYEVLDAQWYPEITGIDLPFTTDEDVISFREGGVSFTRKKGNGKASPQDVSGKAAASNPVIRSDECVKVALIVDLGDSKSAANANHFAKESDAVAKFFESNAFTAQRISQAGGNTIPTLKGDKKDKKAMQNALRDVIQSYVDQLKFVDTECCHEFVLYLSGHGSRRGVSITDPSGNAKTELLKYSDLQSWLSGFGQNVKVVIFIDACYSGASVNVMANLCKNRDWCGFTIMTASSSQRCTPVGRGNVKSATQHFLDETRDLDGDGKKGDSGDRWINMKKGNAANNPKLQKCSNNQPICSTD